MSSEDVHSEGKDRVLLLFITDISKSRNPRLDIKMIEEATLFLEQIIVNVRIGNYYV